MTMQKLPTPYDAEIAELQMRLRRLKTKARVHRLAERQRLRWEAPAYRELLLTKMRSPEQREKTAATARASCSTPEHRAERSARMKAQWADPDMRERMRQGISTAHKARRFGVLRDPIEKQIFGDDARA